MPFVVAKSKAKAKPKAKAKGKSKAKAKARATAPSTESQDEVDIEDQLEDQVEGQAEDQTEADDVDVIDGFVQEEGVQEEDVPNVPAPPNRWNQDICVICHSEMNQDQAGMFHLSLFYEPLIIVTDLYVNSVCLTIPHTPSKQHLFYVRCLFFCFHGMQAVEALVCGHLFHSECINRYCDSTGRDKATACPLKCASSTSTRFFFPQGREAARGSNDPAPVQDDADVNDVNELINEIEAQVVDDSTHREQRVEINDPVVD